MNSQNLKILLVDYKALSTILALVSMITHFNLKPLIQERASCRSITFLSSTRMQLGTVIDLAATKIISNDHPNTSCREVVEYEEGALCHELQLTRPESYIPQTKYLQPPCASHSTPYSFTSSICFTRPLTT